MKVPKKRAESIRNELGLSSDIPVQFGVAAKSFVIRPTDRKKAKRKDHKGCIIQRCIVRHGYPCLVSLRQTAIVEKNNKGQKVVNLYANNWYAYNTAQK